MINESTAPRRLEGLSSPWCFVFTLYFAAGLCGGGIIGHLTAVMYADMGYSNVFIGAVALLSLPTSIRFLWSAYVDAVGTKRNLSCFFTGLMGLTCLLLSLVIYLDFAFTWTTLILFGLLSFFFASLEISADGYYIRILPLRRQAEFVGIKAAAIRLGIIFALVALIRLAGELSDRDWAAHTAWGTVLLATGLIFLAAAAYNFRFLPKSEDDLPVRNKGFALAVVIRDYLKLERVWAVVLLILCYRWGQGLLFFMTVPFYMNSWEQGGMGLSTSEVALLRTYTDIPWMIVGGIVGGFIVKRFGLRRVFIPMAFLLNIPNAFYVYLAVAQPVGTFELLGSTFYTQLFLVSCLESLGYGLGFSAFFFYIHALATGPNKTSILAISSGLMGLGFYIPGAVSGVIQTWMGFPGLFLVSSVVGLSSIFLILLVPMPRMREQAAAD
jgi:MFS transporter, PAT family, beta-lactamase induction signal transducer AmpG